VSDLPSTLRLAGVLDTFSAQFIVGPPNRYIESNSDWMLDKAQSGGGCFINLAPHFVDLFLGLAGGAVEAVAGEAHSRRHGLDVEDHASVVITTASGATATIEVGYTFPEAGPKRHVHYTASGRDGFVEVASSGRYAFYSDTLSASTGRIDVDSDPLYHRFTAEVARTWQSGFGRLPGIDALLETMRVVDQAYSAFATQS
jgi:predicted dehydrogenase